jgi:hypothetical protein
MDTGPGNQLGNWCAGFPRWKIESYSRLGELANTSWLLTPRENFPDLELLAGERALGGSES